MSNVVDINRFKARKSEPEPRSPRSTDLSDAIATIRARLDKINNLMLELKRLDADVNNRPEKR
jgi:hypothetical protein